MIHDPFSLPSKLQLSLLLQLNFVAFYWTRVHMPRRSLVARIVEARRIQSCKWASRGFKGRKRHVELRCPPFVSCVATRVYAARLRESRGKYRSAQPNGASLSRLSRVVAKAISGDAWEEIIAPPRGESGEVDS